MSERISFLLEEIGSALRGLPDVFSTAQWGGRAYKLPGRGGTLKKPKLLAHVYTTGESDALCVSFKLTKDRAAEVIERYAWIEPHSFATLGQSGWLTARLTQKRQAGVLGRLLAESRELHPKSERTAPEGPEGGSSTRAGVRPTARSGRRPKDEAPTDAVETNRLDRVMQDARESGWTPPPADDDAFDH